MHLGETGHEEVVGEFLDAADRQLCPLATQRTRELSIVGVLLVGRLRVNVVVDALFAERVQARQTLGVAVRVEADLADEKLVVDFLREAHSAATRTSGCQRRRRHGNSVCWCGSGNLARRPSTWFCG